MHNLKTALVLLLVLGLVLGCWALPGIAGVLTDRVNQNVPAFAPMEEISFTPTEPAEDTLRYYLERLALHGNMYSVPVEPEDARLTEEQALAAAQDQLLAYEDLGVLAPFADRDIYDSTGILAPSEAEVYAEPHFAIASNDVQNTALYWTVYSNAGAGKNASDRLTVYLDDATGKPLGIDFESSTPLYADCTQDERETIVEQIAMTFLGQFAPENETLASRIHEVNALESENPVTFYEYILSGFEAGQTRYVLVRVLLYDYGFQITCNLI